jgi:predicted nucleic acid-binding protein
VRVYVDTSAYFSLLDRADKNHQAASRVWERLVTSNADLITGNYVLVETVALLQSRLGLEAVSDFQSNIVPLIEVIWIDIDVHHAAVAAHLTANRRRLSLVDCVSFEICRELSIDAVFAFDKHFHEQGFDVLTS